MKYIVLLLALHTGPLLAQEAGFEFGKTTYADLEMMRYDNDTSAAAVVLNEFGLTYKDNESPYPLVLEYHVKIKILKQSGVERGTIEIPVRRSKSDKEEVMDVRASTFGLVDNRIVESKLDRKAVFLDDQSDYWSLVKFAMPDVKAGSIIEYSYKLKSPFMFNWRTWEFQGELPKIKSEFWARIPANYVYNITLRGPFQLQLNESQVLKDCYTPLGSLRADCAGMKYGMKNIPAFHEEKYMTAKSNFLSAIYFELAELKRFDGTSERYTEDWKDVDKKLKSDEQFGVQIRKAAGVWEKPVRAATTGITDPMEKARKNYDLVRDYFLWNETFGHFTQLGARKAYEERKGNIADINLSLVGALQSAGLPAEAAMLSTRANGIITTVHPVMSEFNYVIAALKMGTDVTLLDATSRLNPFGFLPERCLNGKARLVGNQGGWIDIKVKDRDKKITTIDLAQDEAGKLIGKVTIVHHGYDAWEMRQDATSGTTLNDFKKKRMEAWNNTEVTRYDIHGLDSVEVPVKEHFTLNLPLDLSASLIYLSPFMIDRIGKTPFSLKERNYPVDFGAPLDEAFVFTLEVPASYRVDELPENAAVVLPSGGGRFLFSATHYGNKVTLSSTFTIVKSVYTPGEYPALREIFSRMISLQQSQIVLKKNP
ncbi:MAG: hypothetical protein K1X47_03220 [Cyclobacteriaceae bacterium]|nr:hypothetical protein [Cyclobacteriaceae bacterium]